MTDTKTTKATASKAAPKKTLKVLINSRSQATTAIIDLYS